MSAPYLTFGQSQLRDALTEASKLYDEAADKRPFSDWAADASDAMANLVCALRNAPVVDGVVQVPVDWVRREGL